MGYIEMIILDTHTWVWWVQDERKLSEKQFETIISNENTGIGISAISCWEIAKLIEYGKLELPGSTGDWFEQALSYPGIQLLEITPEIAIESTELPSKFHSDPADQIIVATARIYNCPLVTSDRKILQYAHVRTIG